MKARAWGFWRPQPAVVIRDLRPEVIVYHRIASGAGASGRVMPSPLELPGRVRSSQWLPKEKLPTENCAA